MPIEACGDNGSGGGGVTPLCRCCSSDALDDTPLSKRPHGGGGTSNLIPWFLVAAPAPAMTYTALAPVIDHVAPAPAVLYAEQALVDEYSAPAPVVPYAALAPVIDHIAPAPAETYVVQAPVNEYSAPAPAVTNAAPAPGLESVAPAPAVTFVAPIDESSTPLCVGDTGFDTWWGRHCEVIRVGDRHYKSEIRVRYADEDPDDWRSGMWIRLCRIRPDGKRARLRP